MSCQQLIQEDPYIFTDTLSNSTSCNQPIINSQTKYRQTIYSRQFRQHEPTIALSENGIIDGQSKKLNEKIAINPSPKPLHEKRNEVTNGVIDPSKKSLRTSPKFFSTTKIPATLQHHQQQIFQNNDKKFTVATTTNKKTNHSITVSKKLSAASPPLVLNAKKLETQLNHGATPCDITTGSKVNSLNGNKTQTNLHKRKFSCKSTEVNSMKLLTSQTTKSNAVDHHQSTSKTRVIVQPIPTLNLSFNTKDFQLPVAPSTTAVVAALKENQSLSRDERLNQRKLQLRRQIYQFKSIHNSRAIERSKLRFRRAMKLLKMFERKRKDMFTKEIKFCQFMNCSKEVVAMSSHCLEHIIVADKEQQLIKQCSFLYSHGGQCRMPVFDVLSSVAVCREHQNAPPHQLVDPSKPKKATFVARKRCVVNKELSDAAAKLLLKKNGKKPPGRPAKLVIHPNDIQKKLTTTSAPRNNSTMQQKVENSATNALDNHQFIHQNSGNLLASSQSSFSSIASASDDLYLKQDLMTICENNYESSEDTGVGGLSENELMSHDVIGNLDMESTDELAKFCDDILTNPLQTSRDDEEYLDRAIEEVSSVGIDQIAITAFDHFEGLDMLEMMDDIEQRQMISAATNLISMSNMQNFLTNHDQDYAAMPSPMMS